MHFLFISVFLIPVIIGFGSFREKNWLKDEILAKDAEDLIQGPHN